MKKIFLIFMLLLTTTFTTHCATAPKLNKDAGQIQVVPTLDNLDSYDYLGDVSCYHGYNAKDPRTNMDWCKIDLRNQALTMGASHVLLTSQQLGQSGVGYGNNSIAGCPNCITMSGSAYKRKTSPK